MKRPVDILETGDYVEPHVFSSKGEETLFHAYIDLTEYIDFLEEKVKSLEPKKAPPPEFFDWLVSIGKLDTYEAALEWDQDYTCDRAARLAASDFIQVLREEFDLRIELGLIKIEVPTEK